MPDIDDKYDPDLDVEESFEDEDWEYDFERDRICSFPCEVCGESWDNYEEDEDD